MPQPTTGAIVPNVAAEPTVVDAKVVQNTDEAAFLGDLLKYQVQCCGMRIGLEQAKRLMFVMSGIILVLTCCVAGAAVMVTNEEEHDTQPVPPPPVLSVEERQHGAAREEPMDEGPDPCTPNPCHHGGECDIVDGLEYRCRCPTGKVGSDCSVNLDTCSSNPCQNRAKCIDGANRFYCVCAAGFAGDHCAEDLLAEELAKCEKLNCLNGGECHPEGQTGRVLCECQIGYGGDRCENKHKDIPLGHGVDITSALKRQGEFSLKFAGIFSGRNKSGLVVTEPEPYAETSTNFYRSANEFARRVVRGFGLTFTSGMLAADSYVAEIRKASFTAKRPQMYGRSESLLVTEKKTYIACDDDATIVGGHTGIAQSWGCLQLHEDFREAVAGLPASMHTPTQLEAYFEFLVTYGTHYIAEEEFGASIKADYYAEPASIDKAQSVGVQAHALFEQFLRDGNFSAKSFHSGSEHVMKQKIPSLSHVDFKVDSANSAEPQLISVKLRPIAALAGGVSKVKQTLLTQAYKALLGQCLPKDAKEVNGVLHGKICSERGNCFSESRGSSKGSCACDPGFHGKECEKQVCPSAIQNKVCSGNGVCNEQTGQCSCFKVNGTAIVEGEACSSCVHGYETIAVGRQHAPTHISCKDINECEGGSRQVCKDTHKTCTNTLGGHHCTCNPGFTEAADKSCQQTKCPSNTPAHALTTCTGRVGDKCVVQCKPGFISTDPAVCGEDGKWKKGICLHECPKLAISGDCASSGNQDYLIQEHMVNGRPHYKSKDGKYNLYFDSARNAWLLDDDLDAHAIHGFIRNVQGVFPMGKQLWVIYCGPIYRFTELVFNVQCSGICIDTCDGESE